MSSTTQAVASRRPGHLRSDALDLLGLTEPWIIARDLDQATDVAQQTRSDRVTVQIGDLLARVDRVDHSPLGGAFGTACSRRAGRWGPNPPCRESP